MLNNLKEMPQVNKMSEVNGVAYIQQNIFLILAFASYVAVLCTTVFNHELWGDEIHSWNIAKGSSGILDLLSNIRYEGHPSLWYIFLWTTSKFTHTVEYIQLVHVFIAIFTTFIILFYSPFPQLSRILIVFGYYFIFEYATLSRNYALGLLLVFCICLVQNKDFKFKFGIYYPLLFLLSNVHLLACILAASIQLSFLYDLYVKKEKYTIIALHCFLGFVLIMPTLFFIFPPSNSSDNMDYWLSGWNIKQLLVFFQASLKAFLPIPAFGDYNFWNTHFLMQLHKNHRWIAIISYLLSMIFIVSILFLNQKNKRSIVLLITNLFLTLLVSLIFPLTNYRYVGFIFIGFLVASWFCFSSGGFTKQRLYIFNLLFLFQIIPGAYAVCMDIKHPFSNSAKVKDLSDALPAGSEIVTDYWCLNNLSTYLDKPFYCIDMQREYYFLTWETCCKYKYSDPFNQGAKAYFKEKKIESVYFISINPLERLQQLDSSFFKSYDVKLLHKYDKAIEKWSNVYLYQISSKED